MERQLAGEEKKRNNKKFAQILFKSSFIMPFSIRMASAQDHMVILRALSSSVQTDGIKN